MKRTDREYEEFRKYREQMHGVEADKPRISKQMLIILMVIGIVMGALLLMNVFNIDSSVAWLRILIGVILILTGVLRGYVLLQMIKRQE